MKPTNVLVGLALAALAAGSAAAEEGHAIEARGAFSCDFGLDMTKFREPLGAEIERDRIFLQREIAAESQPDPGLIQKHIPFTPTSDTTAFAGGRYLFQGRHQAAIYADLIKRSYTYPGTTQFLERPEFFDPECRDWSVVMAWSFVPVSSHTAMRTERFDTGRIAAADERALAGQLQAIAPSLIDEARARGYAEVHLLHNLQDHKVQIVYFVPRILPPSDLPDVAAFGRVAGDLPLGAPLASQLGLVRVLDRSAFVLTIWQPYTAGDHGPPSLWPNSPPIPRPVCGDGVCVPSQGEDGASCPEDCAPTCGDAVCQPGETQDACPSDCGHPFD